MEMAVDSELTGQECAAPTTISGTFALGVKLPPLDFPGT